MQTSTESPKSAGYSGFGRFRLPNHPPTRKRRLEAALERLADLSEEIIAELDAFDGDPDLEEEPDREEGGDKEASLGSIGALNQELWNQGNDGQGLGPDLEGEHDGREPDEDGEPYLASRTDSQWFGGDDSDRELDDSEREFPLGWTEGESVRGPRGQWFSGSDERETESGDDERAAVQ